MKKKNLLVLLIAILFPLVVTVFIGMYSYGTITDSNGDPLWSKHQTEFKESVFNEEVETKTIKSEPGAPAINGYALKSPMVGVVYLAPEPGADAFVSVGKQIKAGDTVALVEAMKTFNPIKSDRDGVVKEILVSDGAAVEFDQPLVVIE